MIAKINAKGNIYVDVCDLVGVSQHRPDWQDAQEHALSGWPVLHLWK